MLKKKTKWYIIFSLPQTKNSHLSSEDFANVTMYYMACNKNEERGNIGKNDE
jgi:hypothetical protein